jgi:hypothetical protein
MKGYFTSFIMLVFFTQMVYSPFVLAQTYSSQNRTGGKELLQEARNSYKEKPSEAIDLIAQVIIIGLEDKNEQLQAESYELLGDINNYLIQYDLAASNYLKAADLFKRNGETNKELTLYKKTAKAYEDFSSLREAIKYYELFVSRKKAALLPSKKITSKRSKFKDLDVKALDREEIKEVQLTISELYSKLKEYKLSEENLKEVTDDYDFEVATANSSQLNRRIGDVYANQNKDTAALNFYSNSLDIAEKQNKTKEVIQSRDKIAGLYEKTNQREEALSLRKNTVKILEEEKDTVQLAKEFLEIGKLELSLENESEAEEYLEKSVDFSSSKPSIEVKIEGLKSLSSIAKGKGEAQKALAYYQEYIALKEEDYLQKETKLKQQLEINSTINQKQQRINLLEKNDEISAKTIEILRQNDRNQKIWIYSLLGGMLLLAGSGYLMYKNMRQRRVANQLIALKSLRSQMNPHFIFNALNSVNLYISQKDERTANKYLTDFSRLMRLVLEQSQKDFIPLQGELEMIKLYLKLEHDRFEDKFSYDLQVDAELDVESLQIPPMLVQPYIENSIWHGLRYKERKGQLKVKYEHRETGLIVRVEDNGIGRKRSKELKTKNQLQNESTGMYNIENRVKIINDMFKTQIELKIEDVSLEQGTLVTLWIPNKNLYTEA